MTEPDDPRTPAQLRGIFTATLIDEPALTDLIPDAVAGARARKRRERIAYIAAPLAIVGLAAGAYVFVPGSGRGSDGGVSPGVGKTPSVSVTTSAAKKETVIPPLADPFANPGTPEEDCQGNFRDYTKAKTSYPGDQPQPSISAQRAQCIANLRILRALLPGDTVVLEHRFQAELPANEMPLDMQLQMAVKDAEPGTRFPEQAAVWVAALNDPKSPENQVDPNEFLVKTPTGVALVGMLDVLSTGDHRSGTGTCKNGKSGGESSKPCSNTSLADGTAADFVAYPGHGWDMIEIVVNVDRYGNQFFFTVRPSNRDVAVEDTYADGTSKWMDLATGTVHEGPRDNPNPFTKDMLIALTSSPGFMDLYNQVTNAATGH